jgi:hypothetical protein
MIVSVEQSVEWKFGGETEALGENMPQCHCPLQIPHDLTRDRTRASPVGNQQLTVLPMARSLGNTLQLEQERFLLRPFQFVIHYHPTTKRYTLWLTKSILKETTNI